VVVQDLTRSINALKAGSPLATVSDTLRCYDRVLDSMEARGVELSVIITGDAQPIVEAAHAGETRKLLGEAGVLSSATGGALEGYIPPTSKQEMEECLRRLFVIADLDGNGVLDRDEIASLLRISSLGFAAGDIEALLQPYERAGTTSVRYEDFLAFLLSLSSCQGSDEQRCWSAEQDLAREEGRSVIGSADMPQDGLLVSAQLDGVGVLTLVLVAATPKYLETMCSDTPLNSAAVTCFLIGAMLLSGCSPTCAAVILDALGVAVLMLVSVMPWLIDHAMQMAWK